MAYPSSTLSTVNSGTTVATLTNGSFSAVNLGNGSQVLTFSIQGSWAGTFAVYTSPDGAALQQVPASRIVYQDGTTGIASGATGQWMVDVTGTAAFVVLTTLTSGSPRVYPYAGPGSIAMLLKALTSGFPTPLDSAVRMVSGVGVSYDGAAPVIAGTPIDALNGATATAGRVGLNVKNHSTTDGILLKLTTTGSAPAISATSNYERIPPGENRVLSVAAGIHVWLLSESGANTCPFTAVELL